LTLPSASATGNLGLVSGEDKVSDPNSQGEQGDQLPSTGHVENPDKALIKDSSAVFHPLSAHKVEDSFAKESSLGAQCIPESQQGNSGESGTEVSTA